MRIFCLCADWCTACAEYKAVFQSVRANFAQQSGVSFAWIDVEDQADVVDPLDLENFPTVLIEQEEQAVFLGPLTPQKQTLERMLTHFLSAPASPVEPQAQALLQRLLAAGF